MKRRMLTVTAALAIIAGEAAAADCTVGPFLTGPQVQTLLIGNTICSPANCSGAACQWQEQHRGVAGGISGELWDYKKGPTDPVDPSERVGTWSLRGNAMRHIYGANVYRYTVIDNAGSYTFCGATQVPFSVKPGLTGC